MHALQKFTARTYEQVSVEARVFTADPHQLIEMLMDGAMEAIARATGALECGDMELKCAQITKATLIIEEGLRSSLDEGTGGKLARDLDALYRYLVTRLTVANLRNDPSALAECARLLQPIREAWQAIRPTVGSGRLQ